MSCIKISQTYSYINLKLLAHNLLKDENKKDEEKSMYQRNGLHVTSVLVVCGGLPFKFGYFI